MGKIKILTENANLNLVISELKTAETITDITINEDILTYSIDEWASDYDVMVYIMNTLEEKNIESEPFFEDEDNFEKQVTIEESLSSNSTEVEEDNDHDDHDDDDGCCSNHYHEEGFFQAKKGKIIELSIAVAIFILGVVFSFIPSLKLVSQYVYIFAFAVAGYEVMFDGFMLLLKKKFFNEKILMLISCIAAVILGQTAESAGIMILFSVGDLFEFGAVNNSRKLVNDLKKLRVDKATLIDNDGSERVVSPNEVEVGSVILVKAGEKIAIDGVIVEGNANIDTKNVTGESVYLEGGVGVNVSSGCVVVDGALKIKTTRLYADSAVSKIVDIVESASKEKSKSEKFITKFAKYYTPIIVIVAVLITFIPPFFSASYKSGLFIWLERAVMLLCISCPCALVLSVPLTYFCANGSAAKNGVLIKSSERLESLAKCDTIAFDKTGTLTTGEFSVTKIISTKKFTGKVLDYCAICEKNSNHPIAKSILKKYGKEVEGSITDHREIAGRGVMVNYNGSTIICGNAKLLNENGIEFKQVDELGVKLYVAVDNEFAGVVILNDTLRDTARGCILELYDAGVKNTVMLTGDNKEYAVAVRKELNMRQSVSELLPEDKVTEIERLIQENDNAVAFVGDGVNDAPCLSRADVGIAMGGLGSDLAVDSADIVLTDDDLSKIPYAIKLAKRTNSIAKQNIIMSIGVKAIVLLLAVTGLVSSLWLAISADVGVMILTVLNAIRNAKK